MKLNAAIYGKFTKFTVKPFKCIYIPTNDELKSRFSVALYKIYVVSCLSYPPAQATF